MNEPINPFEISCDPTVVARTAALSKRLDLGTLCLADSLARLHTPISKLQGSAISMQMGFETGFAFDEPNQLFTAVVKVNCKGKVEDPNGSQSEKGTEVFSIAATYAIEAKLMRMFESEGERTEHLAAFAAVNAPMMAWPFWRELVQSATSRMGLTPVTAPFLRVKVEEDRLSEIENQPAKG